MPLRVFDRNKKPTNEDLKLSQVLKEEYEALYGTRFDVREIETQEGNDEQKEKARLRVVREAIQQTLKDDPPTALCFSGGGIRSATFNLGILQGLARHGLLKKFHFLSTVSGGGYIGSWLNAWVRRELDKLKTSNSSNDKKKNNSQGLEEIPQGVLDDLKNSSVSRDGKKKDHPIYHLRRFSNYLSPRLGLFSADTWTLFATYFRNLILNWLMFLPFLLALLALPRMNVALVLAEPSPVVGFMTFVIGSLLAVMGTRYVCLNLPSARLKTEQSKETAQVKERLSSGVDKNSQGLFLWLHLAPLMLSAILLTNFWAWHVRLNWESEVWMFFIPENPELIHFALYGAVIHLGGWLFYVSRLTQKNLKHFIEGAIILLVGAFGGCLAYLFANGPWFVAKNIEPMAEFIASFAVPGLLLIFLLAGTLMVGLSSKYTTDEDREWWARSGGWTFIAILTWVGLSTIVIFGPVGLVELPKLLSSIGLISGLISVFLGKSAKTPANVNQEEAKQSGRTIGKNLVLAFATPLFVLILFASLSLGTTAVIDFSNLTPDIHLEEKGTYGTEHLEIIRKTPLYVLFGFSVITVFISIVMAGFVNINKFSLHAMYRNRLIRAYLGASRTNRKPDPFTGFDPKDNLPMNALQQRPLHIVNIALNLVGGEELAWQQRKAHSFTISPLHCGSSILGYRTSKEYGQNQKLRAKELESKKNNPEVEQVIYDRSLLSLGTALTISGAAASPNMGYHSSPVITFLLAFFNVRLGWWLGNPGEAGDRTYDKSSPQFALRPLLAEAFGLTNEKNPYVYLSDGGHFENLGLYEMVLRRCRFIVVCDAGADSKFEFTDLGNAIRKIRMDLGIDIDIKTDNFRSKSDKPWRQCHVAIGNIKYAPNYRALDGTLVYIKASLTGDEPADVLEYATMHSDFPHETTADQFFDESQFESYRRLGEHIAVEVFKESKDKIEWGTEVVFEAVRKKWEKPGTMIGKLVERCLSI